MSTEYSFFSIIVDDPDVALIKFYASDNILETTYQSGMALRATLNSVECSILELLISQPGKVVTRRELTEYAWSARVVADGSLSQAIFNLRTSLHDTSHHNTIQTVPRRGYSFNEKSLVSVAKTINTLNSTDRDDKEDVRTAQKSTANLIAPIARVSKERMYFRVLLLTFIATCIYVASVLKYFMLNPLYEENIIVGSTQLNLVDTVNKKNKEKYKDALKQLQITTIKTPSEVWLSIDHSTYRTYCFLDGDEAAYAYTTVGIFEPYSSVYYCIDMASK